MPRRAIIGVIGGDRQLDASYAAGAAIAQRGWILLTGGNIPQEEHIYREGDVKYGAMLGASKAAPAEHRLIGILPSGPVRWDHSADGRKLYLHTGQPHNVRNVINGRTPDAVLAFGGSRGTLAEIAFTKACGRPLFFHANSLDRLRRRFDENFVRGREANENKRIYFDEPISVYPQAIGSADGALGLIALLEETLSAATEERDLLGTLDHALGSGNLNAADTGFPGLPNDPASKERFEMIVTSISK